MRLLRFVACLAILSESISVVLSAETKRPNIVFLMADDQCTYSMGCYGTPGAKTPNLDQLARDGLVFDNHYDTTAICMASRANVMTGMFEYRTGCNFDTGALLREHWLRSYPVLLRQAGYETAFAGKCGFEVTDKPGKKGRLPDSDFDRWGGGPGQTSYVTKQNKSMAHYAGEYPHSTLSYGAFGRDFIRDAAKGKQPFCLSISFKAPHHPVTPDPKFDDVYEGNKFAKPGNFGREYGKHFSEQSRQGRQYTRFHEWKYSTDYDDVMAKYYQQIYAIDVAVGMIRDALVESDFLSNTVVIYTSDNGFICGSHGYASKVLPYEEASRVPLIVYDGRRPTPEAGRRCEALTGNVDFAPTILELAGLTIPDNMDGRSLLPLVADPGDSIHESLPLINVWGPKEVHSLAVVTRDWKYIYWPFDKGDFEPTEELYDTGQDPLELKNLTTDSSSANQLLRMREVYDKTLAHWREAGVVYHGYQELGATFERKIGTNNEQ
ncbi:MAG: sulfatase [Planctomycetaceae bacterium]|nr:sulfatase [Planctomycetales bacterium]MCB9921907.1 sulfatase [Planctomycetaceae bacterium]